MLFRRELGDETEFFVISLWDSLDSVRGFAGERPEVAVYFPEDERYLLEFEPEVRHYEVSAYATDDRGESGTHSRDFAP
jgi:heme-degrading monooxygenase HmoA